MIKKLKDILNTYSDEELKNMELWVNSNGTVANIIIDDYSINLIEKDLIVELKEGK